MITKKTIFLALLFLLLPHFYHQALASVTIGPTQLDYLLKPGRQGEQEVEIRNQSDMSFRVRINIIDAVQEAGKMKFVYPGETTYSCAAWTTVTPEELSLGPKGARKVAVKIKPAPGAKGSFHGAIIFVVTPVVETESQYRVVGQIGAVVLTSVYIDGTLNPKLEIRDASVIYAPPIRNVGKNMVNQPTAVINFENTGNCMTTLQGEFVIRFADNNRRIASGSILGINYPEPPTLPPGAVLPVLIPLDRPVPEGEYIGVSKFIYGKRKRLFDKIPITVGDGITKTASGIIREINLDFEPKMLDLRLRPGSKRSSSISIINLDKNDVNMSAELFPLALTSDGVPQIGATPPGTPAIDQYFEVKFIPDKIRSGQKSRLVIMAQLPRDTDMPGLGVLRIKAVGQNEQENKPSYIHYPILISSSEDKPASIEIDSVDYLPSPNEKSPSRLVLTMQNSSDSYGFIKGRVEVREEAGFVYGNQTYGFQEPLLLLPEGKREIEILLKEKENLKAGTEYLLDCNADIYEESVKRGRSILKILDRTKQKAKFELEETTDGSLSVKLIEKTSEDEQTEKENNDQ